MKEDLSARIEQGPTPVAAPISAKRGNMITSRLSKYSAKEMLRLISPYSLFALLLNLARMITGLITIRWIAPDQIGVWQVMVLIEGYLMFARFGIINALNRELPFYLGRRRVEKALKFLDVTEWYVLLVSLLFFAGVLLSLWIYNPGMLYWKSCVLTLAIYFPMKFYSGFIEFTFRSGRDFKKLAAIQIMLIICTLFSLLLVYYYGFEGYLFRTVLLTGIGFVLLLYYRPFRFKPRMDFPYFSKLFRMGLPLFVSNYSQSVYNSFPGILLLHFGTVTSLGLYYPVTIVMNLGALIPGIISTYLNPQTSFEFGATKNSGNVISKNKRASVYSLLIMMPVITAGYFLIPPVFSMFAPQYIEAIPASQWALIFALLSCMGLMMNPFAILKAWKPMYIYLAIAGILSFGIPYLMLSHTHSFTLVKTLIISLVVVKVLLIIVNYLCLKLIRHKGVA